MWSQQNSIIILFIFILTWAKGNGELFPKLKIGVLGRGKEESNVRLRAREE